MPATFHSWAPNMRCFRGADPNRQVNCSTNSSPVPSVHAEEDWMAPTLWSTTLTRVTNFPPGRKQINHKGDQPTLSRSRIVLFTSCSTVCVCVQNLPRSLFLLWLFDELRYGVAAGASILESSLSHRAAVRRDWIAAGQRLVVGRLQTGSGGHAVRTRSVAGSRSSCNESLWVPSCRCTTDPRYIASLGLRGVLARLHAIRGQLLAYRLLCQQHGAPP